MRNHLITLAIFSALPTVALAQTGEGTVTGRIFDEQTGESLQGATVKVVGSSSRDFTAEDGRFQLVAPAGEVVLQVEYVGLDAVTYDVVVPESGNVIANIGLLGGALRLPTIDIRGYMTGPARAINQQRTASGIINVISEEDFGQMPDGNIGNALQRLPGLSVNMDQDGSATGINIRGIEADYNSFQIDGNRVPTSGGGRGFDTRQLAAGGITNIEVIKAPTPDRDGDAIGGIINVVSRTAFQRDGREISLSAGGVYSDLPEKWGHELEARYSDIFSIGGGEKNFGISATLSSYRTNRYSLNRDMDWIQVTPELNPELGLDQYNRPVWFMESSHWEYDTRVTDTNTFNLALDFRTDPFNSYYTRFFYSDAERDGIAYETDIDIDTRFQDRADGRKTYAELTPIYGRGTPGDDGSQGSRGWIGTEDARNTDFYSLNFGGRHESPNSLLTYDVFYSRSEQNIVKDNELNFVMEPDDPWLLFEYDLIDVERGEVLITPIDDYDHSDLSLVTEGELEIVTSEKVEEVYSAKVDWERNFDFGEDVFTFKTGAKFRSSSPRFDQTVDLYSMDETFPYAEIVVPNNEVLLGGLKYYDVIPAYGIALLDSNPELFEFEVEDSLEDSNFEDYDATEETLAGYVMGTYRTGPHMILVGVRYEEVSWDNTNYRVSFLDGESMVTEVNSGDSYGFWLPGIHLRHELAPNLILRESYNRSYGRPRLSELTAGRFINEDGDITDGNPNLQPAVSDNYDAQIEYYTESGGLFSIGVFYKDVEDFSYEQSYDFNELDANGIPIPAEDGDFEYEFPTNGSTAKNYGVELIARQRLTFLPGALSGLRAGMSATFADSEATYPNRDDNRDLPVPGFSDFLFTASLEWAWKSFDIRADYRYRNDYVEGLGSSIESDEFYGAEQRLDMEANYQFENGLGIYASATNLTDEPQVSYQGYEQFVEDASLSGRKFTIGVDYTF